MGLFSWLGSDAEDTGEYKFVDWSPDCVEESAKVVEKTLKEAIDREHVIYTRAGALLSLSGIMLALICTYMVRINILDTFIVGCFSVGVTCLVAAAMLLAYTLIPSKKCILNMESFNDSQDYAKHKDDKNELAKMILEGRIKTYLRVKTVVKRAALHLGYAAIIAMYGLSAIGIGMIKTLNPELSIMIFVPIVIFISCCSVCGVYKLLRKE